MIRRSFKIAFAALAILLVAGVAAPKFGAERYRRRIQNALESALNRKVTFGAIHFNLLTGPGFSVEDVAIGEDSELGAEPIAYVTGSLTAVPRLWSLWTGHLEFSSLRLDEAQINLSRTQPEPGRFRWNFERLMRASIVAAFPNISIRNSRINFKAEDLKSVVYLLDCDLDITPPSSAKDSWQIRFEGKPARTDRPARGSGVFTVKGTWSPSDNKLNLNLQLDRSELGDVVALIRGEDIGLHGAISGKAHLAGPPAALAINGRLNVAELHGWDQSIPQGEVWRLDLTGVWNVHEQQLKVDAGVAGKVAVHYRVEKYFSQPRWGVSLSFQNFSIEPLVSVARHLGAPLPEALKLTGRLDAAVGYSGTLEGAATLHNAALSVPGAQPVELESAQVVITQGHARLFPTRVIFPNKQEARFEANYTIGDPAPEFTVATAGLNVQALTGIPLLSSLQEGQWNGQLRFDQKIWSGNFQLADAVAGFPGFAEPLKLASAEGRLDGARVALQRMRVSAGDVYAEGEYRYEPGAARPHRFHLTIPELDMAVFEKLAMPALSRKGSLFSFGKAPAPPDWLRQLRADGTIRIDTLHAAALEFDNVRSRILWDGVHVAWPDLSAAMGSGTLAARLLVDLSGRTPAYEAVMQLSGVPWKSGKVDADTVLQTSGLGADTLTHMRSTGSFAGRNVIDDYPTVTGRYNLRWSALAPSLNFTDLRLLTDSDEVLTGKASLQNDGTLLVQLANGTRQLKVNLQ